MTDLQEIHVVTCFVLRRDPALGDQTLVLRRSRQVGTYRGRWAGVSGYVEQEPLAQAHQELHEEVGLAHGDVRLLAQGAPLPIEDLALGRRWIVHPFLFQIDASRQISLDWEHTEARWVAPEALATMDTVPGLAEALARVYRPQQ